MKTVRISKYSDPTSIFVEHNGEIKEVSRAMMETHNA